jgi:hypothetical protein
MNNSGRQGKSHMNDLDGMNLPYGLVDISKLFLHIVKTSSLNIKGSYALLSHVSIFGTPPFGPT